MKTLKTSHAKINLTLEVIKKTPSGFHKIRTVMTKLPNLKDRLVFHFKKNTYQISIKANNPMVPCDNKNLCYKAAEIFFATTGKKTGVEICLYKKIPIGAGLGGGSSNAATTFLALNEYFKKPLSLKKLEEIASKIGKDIPFFLGEKNTALMENFGEKRICEMDVKIPPILVINPLVFVSTAEAYQLLKKRVAFMEKRSRKNLSQKLIKNLENKKRFSFENVLYNDFEMVIQEKNPIIKEIKQALLAFGAKKALMSGSGPTVFGIFENKEELLQAKRWLKKKYPQFIVEKG